MDWQLGLVLLAVGLAAAYVFRQTWRSWSPAKGGGCGGGCCGKGNNTAKPAASAPRIIPVEELTLRIRGRS